MPIFLGIDPGIADTGYGVISVSGNLLRCITYGSIKTDKKDSDQDRLLSLYNQLSIIIKTHQPQAVGMEKLFFNTNAKTAMIVGQARGVAVLTVAQAKLPLYELTPPQVKSAVCASGSANKAQVQKMVKLILGLKEVPKPDDAADALAVAIGISAIANSKLCQNF